MNPTKSPQSPAFEQETAGALSGAKQTIKDATRETVNTIKDTASRVKEQAVGAVDEQRTGVADRIGSYSSAVHKTAQDLEQNDPNIAWLTHRAADRLSDLSEYVRSRDFTQLKSDAEDLARRHPAAFFGGLFVAGLVVGNLLKASGRSATQSTSSNYSSEDSYPRAENVPTADVPGDDPWPAAPEPENLS